jgi:hypothetical protein
MGWQQKLQKKSYQLQILKMKVIIKKTDVIKLMNIVSVFV